MARKRGKRPAFIQKATQDKPSFEIPWLALGAAALIGFPLLRDATSDSMRRNHYADRGSCECDYADRCTRDLATGSWDGPWYADDAADRKADDPGEGACRRPGGYGNSGGGYYSYGRAGAGGYRGPVSIEHGYRGGFGGTAHVRAAGS